MNKISGLLTEIGPVLMLDSLFADGAMPNESPVHIWSRINELQSIVLMNLEFDGARVCSAAAVDPEVTRMTYIYI